MLAASASTRILGQLNATKSQCGASALPAVFITSDVTFLRTSGTQRFTLPDWFSSRFPARYHQRALFDVDLLRPLLDDDGYALVSDHAAGLYVSTRERALLEVLNEVGVTQDLEEATHLFESFSSTRLEVVGALLAACTRIKTVRLFLQFAQQTNAIDVDALRERFSLKLGSGTRWTRRLQDGIRLTIK